MRICCDVLVAVVTAAMLLACVPVSASVLTLDDNNTHDLNSAVADYVEVYTSTTANFLTGGSIGVICMPTTPAR